MDVVSLLPAFSVVAIWCPGCMAGFHNRALPLKLASLVSWEECSLREITGGNHLLGYPVHYEIAYCCELLGPAFIPVSSDLCYKSLVSFYKLASITVVICLV